MRVGFLLGVGFLLTASLQAAEMTVLRDGDFEREGLRFAKEDRVGEWRIFNHGKADAQAVVAASEGRGGTKAVRYTRTAPGSDNFHLDQIVPVEPRATYEVRAWVKADGRLNPMLVAGTPTVTGHFKTSHSWAVQNQPLFV